jgi:hypothetical protein
MDKALILSILREGGMRLEGRFIYGSNFTFLAFCQFGNDELRVVYKPMEGEQPLWDFPTRTLARREVAAYLVSEALGWDLVPPTVFRLKNSPMGPGSVQLFIDHDPDYHYFTFKQSEKAILPKVMAFDILINNADRKGGHFLLSPEGKLWLIDHGLSFNIEDKLRTVVWDHAGQSIPKDILADIKALLSGWSPQSPLVESLQPHLTVEERDAFKKRAQALVESGGFPLPPEERRAYPWPLV